MEMIQKFVISPCCKNEVKLRGDTVICVKCGRKFAVINGLLVDTLNEQPDYDNKQREVWDRHYLDKEYIARAEKNLHGRLP